MISYIKEKISAFAVSRMLKEHSRPEVSFTGFFTSSYTFFIIMPEDEKDFAACFELLNFLENQRKNIILFVYDFKVSLLPIKYRPGVLTHGVRDITKWDLPTKAIREKLNSMSFDVVIDLNREYNLYSSFVSNLVKSRYVIGFKKADSDQFYNLQAANDPDSAELSYKNLLNCLGMF
jgi:hypothetical protein